MKVIVVGASFSGKTTLVRYLKDKIKLPLSEMDERLTKLNNGKFPDNNEYKHNILAPQVIHEIINSKEVVFFTNTNYFETEDLRKAHKSGFKIVQLQLSLDDLNIRNKKRMTDEGYDDMGQWLPGMIDYQNKIQDQGLVDKVINANQTTEEIANELLQLVNH